LVLESLKVLKKNCNDAKLYILLYKWSMMISKYLEKSKYSKILTCFMSKLAKNPK